MAESSSIISLPKYTSECIKNKALAFYLGEIVLIVNNNSDSDSQFSEMKYVIVKIDFIFNSTRTTVAQEAHIFLNLKNEAQIFKIF